MEPTEKQQHIDFLYELKSSIEDRLYMEWYCQNTILSFEEFKRFSYAKVMQKEIEGIEKLINYMEQE